MTKTIWTITIATILLAGIVAPALTNNAFATISGGEVDKTTFLTDTGATSSTGVLPNLGKVGLTQVTIGTTQFKSASGDLYMGAGTILSGLGFNSDWTSLIPGNTMAISNVESLDVTFGSSVYSAGFDFVEPSCNRSECSGEQAGDIGTNVNNGFVDSEFTVTLKSGLTTVGTFTFEAQNDVATFVGVTSDESFDKMEIRETTGGSENEYFGEFYSSDEPLVTEVNIDIKPGSDPSSVSCKNLKGTVPVAIFTTDSFDAADIELSSLMLEGVPVTEKHNSIHLEDIDDDGDGDAVLHLDKDGVCAATLGLDKKVTEFVTLSGNTSSEEFEGIGDIRIIN